MMLLRSLTVITIVLGLLAGSTYAEDEAPTSASDVTGNVKSFFNGLGKGVKVAPNTDRVVVARGILPGLPRPPYGFDYNAVCYEGEELPSAMQNVGDGRNGVVGGTFKFSATQLLKCKDLIAKHVFTVMPPGVTQRNEIYMANQRNARLPLSAPNSQRRATMQPVPGDEMFDKIRDYAQEKMARSNAEQEARSAELKARSAERVAQMRQQRQQIMAKPAGAGASDACAAARDILNNPAGYPPQAIKGMHDFLATCPGNR